MTSLGGDGIRDMDFDIVPAGLADVAPFLRAANEVEEDRPRVAYLLRFHAFEKAHELDPTSSGRGVRQFKTALLERLEADNKWTVAERQRSSDAREIQSFYQQYYQNYVKVLDNANIEDRARLSRAYATAHVLFEVLCAVNKGEAAPVSEDVMETGAEVEAQKDKLIPYNILPLDAAGEKQAIMKMPEIVAATSGLRYTTGLHFSNNVDPRNPHVDVLDWLGSKFGFQSGNIRNQREHFILLLANVHIRLHLKPPQPEPLNKLDIRAVDEVMKKILKNYKTWCKYLHRRTNLSLPTSPMETMQRKLIYTALFLLIWGEAGNLRFIPECLCYIYHHMAGEVMSMLGGTMDVATGAPKEPAYGGPEGTFLRSVIKPVYDIVSLEAKNSNHGSAPHSKWRNYDDFNEYFWSVKCFELGWPMRADSNFFVPPKPFKPKRGSDEQKRAAEMAGRKQRVGKINFVEHRTFAHIFRSFDRMWIFLILLLQGMIIVAFATLPTAGKCDNLGKCVVSTTDVLKSILSIFITEALLRFIVCLLDIVLAIGMYASMKKSSIIRYFLKAIWFGAWFVVLAVTYAISWRTQKGVSNTIRGWVGQNIHAPSLYLVAVAIYLIPYALSFALFFVPCILRCIENSNLSFIRSLLWWSQTSLYVGRGMHESQWTLLWYSVVWVLMLLAKTAFSYWFQIKPLAYPTYQILRLNNIAYVWHEFFPGPNNKNFGALISLWAPVVLVYFFDLQIWYAIFSTLIGGAIGAFQRLGEIRTLDMMRSRFRSVPGAFAHNLIPADGKLRRRFFSFKATFTDVGATDKKDAMRFGQLWNEMIYSFREEDLISDKELALLQVPYASGDLSVVQWPPFLLASKIPIAVKMAKTHSEDNRGPESRLWKKFEADEYMQLALVEAYDSFKKILAEIVIGTTEKWVITSLFGEAEQAYEQGNLLGTFRMKHLSKANNQQPDGFIEIVTTLTKELMKPEDKVDKNKKKQRLTKVLQDLYEKVTRDMLDDKAREVLEAKNGPLAKGRTDKLFASHKAIQYPALTDKPWMEQIKRLYLLLSTTESAMEVPTNLEARRRLTFFTNSLFMDMPRAPHVRYMQSFCVMTPYYAESVLFSKDEYSLDNEDGVSILFYLQKIYPDEWDNFLERMKREHKSFFDDHAEKRYKILNAGKEPSPPSLASPAASMKRRPVRGSNPSNMEEIHAEVEEARRSEEAKKEMEEKAKAIEEIKKKMDYGHILADTANKTIAKEVCLWTSYRGQTLQRTVRGMSYYRRALQLQAFIDLAEKEEFSAGYRAALESPDEVKKNQSSIYAQLQAVADIKFTYVVTAQIYGKQKAERKQQASDISDLLKNFESLRVAYIDEVEDKLMTTKEHYSVLVKSENGIEQEVYRIKLPGPAILGEGKPENQNHAIVFSRGEALQTIDMNQDNYLEEAFKMRNLLQEFSEDHGVRPPTILGVREHIFTGSVSSLAWFMSLQELSFVTLGQRVLANPLKVRFHYGHPDVFDRLFHITRGGISKASKSINISEDIFVGFQTTLRRGNVTHHEYIQVGKGRDVGLNQISTFEGKVAGGNGEQCLSRDVHRLGQRFDFFRMLSTYYTTIGFYFNTLLIVLTVYAFLYGRVYLALSGVESAIVNNARLSGNTALQTALASQSIAQLGLLMALPMVMEIGLERGFRTAVLQFFLMQLQGCSIFFTFLLGTKTHYFGRTLLHGGAGYKATGRGFVVRHEKFAENYRLYSRSHFTKALEIFFLLTIYAAYSTVGTSSVVYLLVTMSMWFLVVSFLFAPFIFNPSGFEWQKTVEDWNDFLKWIQTRGGIGIEGNQSWESWWEKEQTHLNSTGFWGRAAEIVLSVRFLLYQYGVVYHLNIAEKGLLRLQNKPKAHRGLEVYGLSWLVIVVTLAFLKLVSVGRKRFSSDFQLLFRIIKAGVFFGICLALVLLWAVTYFSFSDLFAALLAFIPTGWFMLQVSQALRPVVERLGFWESFKSLARAYEYVMATIIFVPVAVLAWFPFTNEFQSRLLFNTAFSRGLQISRVLAGTKKGE